MAISHFDNLDALRPVRLLNRHLRILRDFLRTDLEANLFLLSWLENHGVEPLQDGHFAFWGYFGSRGELTATAVNISNRLLMLDALDPLSAARFGEFFAQQQIRFLHVVSAARSVTPFWNAYQRASSAISARLIQNQELFCLQPDQFIAPDLPPSQLRRANLSEMDPLFLASAQMHREETKEDPLGRDPDAFRRHVRYRISHGRTFVWFDPHRRLLFKADISTRCALGAQISGVYTSPHCRNQGIATRAMRDLSRFLFAEDLPLLTLYVNETNQHARRLYEKIGFQFHCPYQTVFVAD